MPHMSRAKGVLVFTVIGLITISAAMVLGEMYLSAVDKPADHHWGWTYQGPRENESNQFGFRGRPISYKDDDYVVLIVGDSQVESNIGRFEKMPEWRLQYHLSVLTGKRVRVFSIAAGGYGQDQQLLALEKYFQEYSADLVLVWETPGNDVWNNMFPTHWPRDGTPKPTFWLDSQNNLQGPRTRLRRFRILDFIERVIFERSLDRMWEQKYLPPANELATSFSGRYRVDSEMLNPDENIENGKTHLGLSLVR